MFKLDNKIEVRCPFCDTVQKVPCDVYECNCKKCGKTFVTEEALEYMVSGKGSRMATIQDDLPLEELIQRGENCVEAEDFGLSLEYAQRAVKLDPNNAEALWLLCKSKICGIAPSQRLVDYVNPDKRDCVVSDFAQEQKMEIKMAEYRLEMAARKHACYTDEETDGLMQKAADLAQDRGDELLAARIEDEYRLYSYKPIRLEEDAQFNKPKINIMNEIMPNFGRQKSAIDIKTLSVFLFGCLAAIGGLVLILTGFSNGWTIALLVIGILLVMVGGLAIKLDSRRRDIVRVVKKVSPCTVDDVIRYCYNGIPTEETALQEARYHTLVTLYELIKVGQLVCVGVQHGSDLVYYNADGEELSKDKPQTDASNIFDAVTTEINTDGEDAIVAEEADRDDTDNGFDAQTEESTAEPKS